MSFAPSSSSPPAAPPPRDFLAFNPAVLAVVLLLGCSGGTDLLLPGDGVPADIEVIQGDGQSGRVGEPLADPLVVEVTDSKSRPVEGASVAFEFTSAAPGAAVVPATATTDANGHADARLVLGTTIGTQTGQVRVVMPEGNPEPKAPFTAMALSENANGIAAVSGDDQTGPAGSTLSQPLVVQVTDAFGNPISGVPIGWAAEGGGSVSQATATTDGEGRASVERTLGPTAGLQTTLAGSPGLAGSPVTFVHTATAGNASGLSIVSGNNQTAAAGTRLPADLVVRLVDADGNGVPGAAVTWLVSIGGGSVSPENGITDEAGQASAQWTLGPNPGANRVDAVVSGVGIVNFTAVGTTGAPAGLSIRTQPSSSARNGVPLDRQPVVQVQDARGNDVPTAGVEVTAQLGGGGGSVIGTTQRRTDGSGRATFTDLAIIGATGRRTLVFTASGYAGAISNEIDVSALTTSTTITSDSPDPSAPGAPFTAEFRVSAAGLTPTGTVTVTDGAQSCTGTLAGGAGSCQLALSNAGQRTLTATYSGAPGFSGSSDTEDHLVEAPAPQNQPPTAAFTVSCNNLKCLFNSDASSDPDGRIVSWNWSFGDGSVSTSRNPDHTYSGAGTYTVTLTVTDDDQATGSVSDQVTVSAPQPQNKPPHAEFEVSCTELTCTFTDKSKDDDGNLVAWFWDFGDGSSSNQQNPTHGYAAGGRYHVTLTVTDDDGASNSKTRDADPKAPPPNKAPSADFDEQCTDLTCTFTDKSKDDDGSIVNWSWDFGDATSSGEQNPSHTYTAGSSYDVTLTVTDDDGATSSKTRQITVTAPPPPNQTPTAEFTSSCSDLTCDFTDQSTDSDGSIVSRSWNFGDGGSSSDQNPPHTYASASTYTVTLTVTDDEGATNSVSHSVSPTAPNQAPTAQIGAISCTGMSCTFSDASTDPNGNQTISHWDWAFGDGGSSNLQNPSHDYATSGDYIVTLTVSDDHEATGMAQENVTVSAPSGGGGGTSELIGSAGHT